MVRQLIDVTIKEVTEECCKYMGTEEGKREILNPDGQTPIMDVPLGKSFVDEIQKRIGQHIENKLKSEYVTRKFESIRDKNVAFYQKASKDLTAMEGEWTNEEWKKSKATDYEEEKDIPFFLEMPLLIVTGVLIVLAAVFAFIFSPIFIPVAIYFYTEERKKKIKIEIINKMFSTCLSSVDSQIHDYLDGSCGYVLKLLSEKMLDEALPRRIRHLETIIHNLELSRETILANVKSLKNIAREIEVVKKSASELKKIAYE